MVSHPELGSDPPIGSDRGSGCDSIGVPVHVEGVPVHFALWCFSSIVAVPETSPIGCQHPQ